MKKIQKKREELQAKYINASGGFQKGFTLLEMLVVVLIILILIGIMVMSFNFFGRVDGTELVAKSKSVESAVLQVALGDDERAIPGVGVKKRNDKTKFIVVTPDKNTVFDNEKDALVVLEFISGKAGLTVEQLRGLMVPVEEKSVKKSVAGNVDVTDYFVIVKKDQLYTSDVEDYKEYNDELSGLVFSKETVIDSEGKHYNGTSTAKKVVTP